MIGKVDKKPCNKTGKWKAVNYTEAEFNNASNPACSLHLGKWEPCNEALNVEGPSIC